MVARRMVETGGVGERRPPSLFSLVASLWVYRGETLSTNTYKTRRWNPMQEMAHQRFCCFTHKPGHSVRGLAATKVSKATSSFASPSVGLE